MRDNVIDHLVERLEDSRGIGQGGWHRLDVRDHSLLAAARVRRFLERDTIGLSRYPAARAWLAERCGSGTRGEILVLAGLAHDLGKRASIESTGDMKAHVGLSVAAITSDPVLLAGLDAEELSLLAGLVAFHHDKASAPPPIALGAALFSHFDMDSTRGPKFEVPDGSGRPLGEVQLDESRAYIDGLLAEGVGQGKAGPGGSGRGLSGEAARPLAGSLEEMGFYTLTDKRCAAASPHSPLGRCVLVVTDRCNFSCPYCRKFEGGDLPEEEARAAIELWAKQGLQALVLTGGEPCLHPGLPAMVALAKERGVTHVAIATNGSASRALYSELVARGADDFSVSLDASEAALGDRMAGGLAGAWERVVDNIRYLSVRARVTVGIVLDRANEAKTREIVEFADSLGVSDIRLNPAAQSGRRIPVLEWGESMLERHPTFAWRAGEAWRGGCVRGLEPSDASRCHLVLDEMTVRRGEHYPCFVYLREGGAPIGRLGAETRRERATWSLSHDPFLDPICRENCPDICRRYNKRHECLGRPVA